MVLVGVGTVVGLRLALAAQSMLFGLGALNPVTFIGVPAILLSVT